MALPEAMRYVNGVVHDTKTPPQALDAAERARYASMRVEIRDAIAASALEGAVEPPLVSPSQEIV